MSRKAVGLAILAACALWPSPAQATMLGHEHFDFTESNVPDNVCGISVLRTTKFSGSDAIRVGKNKSDQAFFQRVVLREVDFFVNPLNGRSFSISANSLFNEVKATRVSGDVFSFRSVEAGQPFVLRDSSGRVVQRDRGVVRRIQLFDTLGDGQPGGVVLDEQILNIAGPHPGLEQTDAQFCAIVTSLIG